MNPRKVTVRTRGGALGLDRLVEVADGHLKVSEHGSARATTLSPEQQSRLDAATDQLAAVQPTSVDGAPDVADGGFSEIGITGDTPVSLRVAAGSDAPTEVWDLLELVDELCGPS